MRMLVLSAMIALLCTLSGTAAEKKPIKEVDTNALTRETQVIPKSPGDTHVAIAWWIPDEFWDAVFSRDTNTSEQKKQDWLKAIAGVSMIAIVQADITKFGGFQFYSKAEIEENMVLSFTDSDGKNHGLSPMQTIDPDLEIVLGVFKPILTAAMGNLGSNLHFFVLADKDEDTARLLDPYKNGQLNVKLTRRDSEPMDAHMNFPLDALFVPRKCPNGQNAHIAWNYCPWTGQKLED